ncbi:glycosyltransferase [Bacteroides fragilis]
MRKYFHIKKKEKIILFVGRLTALKGAYILLDSFKKISPYHTNYRLFIIGDGDFNLLLNQAEPYWDRITFTGKIDKEKLNQLYKIADIGIIPSYCEQCSYVCLEMMMNAIPCIVSDGIGLNSIFKNNINSIVAKIVDYQNPDSYILNLEKSILDMINNASKKDNISKNQD